ncbi:MAG: permease-like cell division protein FtsX [Alistipes sp.]|nr:permease-like cell division protein FtsX [Alistipes sp.]
MEQRDKRIARKVRRSYIISTVSITLVLFMLGIVSYVTLSALSAAHNLRERVVVSVEMADSLFAGEQQVVLDKINSREEVARVDYLSKEDKVNDAAFRRQFELEIDELLGENPLRNSYEVTLKRELSTREDIEAFVSAVEPTAGVEYISVPPVEVVEQMHSTITTISLGLLIFLAVLLVISLLLLHNTIRLAIYSKRYLINTLKLVGATKWYIMRPLLGSALKQGVWAGVISGLMIAFTVYGVEAFTPQGIAMLDHIAVGIIIGSTLSVGVVITLLYTAAAVNKFVNMKTNKIYLY